MSFLDNFIKTAGSWMIAGGVVQAISGFGANVVLARNLAVSDFGTFAIIHSVIGLIALIINSCVGTLAINSNDKDFESKYRYKLHSVLLIESFFIVLFSSIVLLIFNIFNLGSIFLLLGTVAINWSDFQLKFIERENKFKKVSIIETISEVISHILALIGLILGFGAVVLYARFLFKALIRISVQILYGGIISFHLSFLSIKWFKKYINEVKFFYISGMLESGFERIILLFLGAFSGVKDTGFFFQARRLAIVPHQILQPYFFRILFNSFSRNDSYRNSFKELNKNMIILLILLSFALLLTFTIGKSAIIFIFGIKWEPVILIIYALSGIIIASVPFELLKAFYQAKSNKMRNFLLLGRGVQYCCLIIAMIVSIMMGDYYVYILSLGISGGYIFASIILYYAIYYDIKNKVTINEIKKTDSQ